MNKKGRPHKNPPDGMTKRLHIYADDKTCKVIREECEGKGISISDYLVDKALNFQVKDISEKLEYALEKAGCTEDEMTRRKESRQYIMREIKESGFQPVDPAVTKQFHLRVTQETYEKIKTKAAQFSMTVSDYIVFTTTHFDIAEISEKIDKINEQLELMNKRNG